jgi:predicted O-methyltransferase YrrM
MTNKSNVSKFGLLLGRLLKLALVNPRGLREVFGVTLGSAEGVMDPETDVLPIPCRNLEDLVREETEPLPLAIRAYPSERFSISIPEAFTLAVLMHRARTRRVFEFGTHRGVSTTQLATNLPADGMVFTLDLPVQDRTTQFAIDNVGDLEVSRVSTKGDLIPEGLRSKITFLNQDSAKFDPTPYANAMDFIFIDGAHTANYVANDTEKAWVMLKPGGIMAWHDCRPQTPDVVKYLRHCRFHPQRIRGTTLAFATKPA